MEKSCRPGTIGRIVGIPPYQFVHKLHLILDFNGFATKLGHEVAQIGLIVTNFVLTYEGPSEKDAVSGLGSQDGRLVNVLERSRRI